MNYLCIPKPLADTMERMGVPLSKVVELEYLKSILPNDEYWACDWAAYSAHRSLHELKSPLFHSLQSLENICPFTNDRRTYEAMKEDDDGMRWGYKRGLEPERVKKNRWQGHPVVCDAMLLGESTLAIIVDTKVVEDGWLSYELETVPNFAQSMGHHQMRALLKIIGEVSGANHMLSLPLLKENILN